MVEQFYDFLCRVDNDFLHPLSSKVNLREYARKLADTAYVSFTAKDDKIIGCVAMYCNDLSTMCAYIPLVGVDKDYRGQHLSKALMNSAISIARGRGFKKIAVHTENDIAYNLYLSLGFVLVIDGPRKYLELSL